MSERTELANFLVVDESGTVQMPTVVNHHIDIVSGYELVTISQTNEDGDTDVVCLHREQFLAIQLQLKGH